MCDFSMHFSPPAVPNPNLSRPFTTMNNNLEIKTSERTLIGFKHLEPASQLSTKIILGRNKFTLRRANMLIL